MSRCLPVQAVNPVMTKGHPVSYTCVIPHSMKNLIFDALVVTLDNKPPTLLGVHCEQLQSFEKSKRRKGESPETAGLKAGAVTQWNASATMPV